MLAISSAIAQTRTIKGRVIGEADGEPLIGAAIVEKGSTSNGVVADINGNFSITVPSNATLVVSYIGFTTQQVKPVANNIVIKLKEDAELLGDVVVVGYGTMRKSDITGSVVTVDREQMMKRTPTNIGQALQGAAAGVHVSLQDGAPDANAAIRIRGIATINGTADPLYVVDGIPVGTNANFVNPGDIENVEILKDASATAIYGNQGANGVVMVATKDGAKGKTRVNFTADFGIQTLPYKLETLGIEDYAKSVREARANQGASTFNALWDKQYDGQRNYIDWQDQMTQSAFRQQYGLSASGGSEKSTYNVSLGYLNADGIVVGTNMNRLTFRANATANPTKYLKVGGDINYVHRRSHGSNIGMGNNGNTSSLRDYAFWAPTLDYVTENKLGNPVQHVNVVNPDGTYGAGQLFVSSDDWEGNTRILHNPYASQMESSESSVNRFNRVMVSAFAEITFMKGLTYKTTASLNYYSSDTNRFEGGYERYNNVGGTMTAMNLGKYQANDYSLSLNASSSYSYRNDGYFTYNYSDDLNNVTAMIGYEVSQSMGQWVGGSAAQFQYATIRDLSMGAKRDPAGGAFNLENKTISYFGRLVYSFKDRYILTATMRRDGSSHFGANKKWGSFFSGAFAWRVKEESFLQDVDEISNLKLRLGYGSTGNAGLRTVYNNVSSGIYYNYYPTNGQMGLGTNMNRQPGTYIGLVDDNRSWETNTQLNIGVDLGLLNGDLNITADYFIRNTTDLLVDRNIRPSTGFSNVYTNYGEIRNSGLELSINYRKQINKDLSINAGLNSSFLSNKVVTMENPHYATNTEGGNGKWNTIDGSNVGAVGDPNGWKWGGHSISMEGHPVGAFYGYRTDGIIQNQADLDAYMAYWAKDDNGAPKVNFTTASVGDFKFKDLNGDKVLDDNDRDILGKGLPTFTFGLSLGANYKNWDFSAFINGVLGQDIFSYSAMRLSTVHMGDDQTFPNILKDSYSKVAHVENNAVTNPGATLPRLCAIDQNYNMRASDAWVKNGNFLRLSNLQVGYTFNQPIIKSAGIESVRLYAAVSNLFVLSPYTKYGDPEVGQGSVLYSGFDTGRYPMPRSFQFGLNVNF